MFNIGPQELLLILVIALVVVGPSRLPELGRSIGRGLREIRKAQDEVKRTIQVNLDEPPRSTTRASAERARAAAADREPPTTTAEPAVEHEAVPPPVVPDPTPQATEPPAASEVSEISRTLGRSLAELRRAREEVQRSFRVDLNSRPAPPTAATPSRTPASEAESTGTPSDETRAADETPAG